jgi:hypothetical protein
MTARISLDRTRVRREPVVGAKDLEEKAAVWLADYCSGDGESVPDMDMIVARHIVANVRAILEGCFEPSECARKSDAEIHQSRGAGQ